MGGPQAHRNSKPLEAGVNQRHGDATPTTTRHRLITQTPTLSAIDKPAEREQDCASLIRGFPSDKFIFGRMLRAASDSVKSRDLVRGCPTSRAFRDVGLGQRTRDPGPDLGQRV